MIKQVFFVNLTSNSDRNFALTQSNFALTQPNFALTQPNFGITQENFPRKLNFRRFLCKFEGLLVDFMQI